MADLPTDTLLEEILPRCEAKSLLKFKCVSKSFNTLISSSKFISLHLRHCCYNPNRFLVLDYGPKSRIPNGICCVDIQSQHSHQLCPLPLPKILTSNNNGSRVINIVGSCNGLLCVALYGDDVCLTREVDILFVLLNPCTGMYAQIPIFEGIHKEIRRGHRYVVRRLKFGFGYDTMSFDYKVVVIVDCNIVVNENFMNNIDVANEITREVFVYSKNLNSWSLVESTSSSSGAGLLGGNNAVLINGHLLHWVFECYNESRIGCFDLRIDQWVQDVPLPDYYKNNNVTNWYNFADKRIEVRHIGLLDKSLCLLTENPRNVWIMKEYGVRESWVKLLGDSDSPQITKSLTFCPLAYRGVTSNEVLVTRINQKKRTEFVWYNITEKKIQRVDQIFKSRKVYDVRNAYVCEPTLVELPGGIKIEAGANKVTDVSDDRYRLKKYGVPKGANFPYMVL